MILITGGTGYLGSRLAHYLSDFGHEVVIASRHKKTKFAYLKNFKFTNFDLQNKKLLKQCLKNVDTVFHLADLNAQNSYLNPKEAIDINGKGTLNLLEAAIEKNVKNFIYFSTIHVYGDNLKGHVTENTPLIPNNPYAISTRLAEDFVKLKSNHINSTILRLSNIIACPLSSSINCWNLIVNDLCRQIVKYKKVKINSNKNTIRDFNSIKNLLFCCRKLIESKPLDFEIFNMSFGKSTSFNSLANLLTKRTENILKFSPSFKFDEKIYDKKKYKICSNKIIKYKLILNKETFKEDLDDLLISSYDWFK